MWLPKLTLVVGPQPNASTLTFRIWDFMRMKTPNFHGTKVDKDPQGFIEEVFKVVDAMGVAPREKVELVAYQLKDVPKMWFEQWKDERPLLEGPEDCEAFK